MFTGIIEEIGIIKEVRKGTKSIQLSIQADKVLSDVKLGDSIATNGICLTVTKFDSSCFSVDVMPESIKRTSLGNIRSGMMVNLERAVRVGDRLGGHIVSGHIDGVGTIEDFKEDDNAIWVTINASSNIMKYIIEKGSIAIDGVSLTVAYADNKKFKVSIIPHTKKETILCSKKIGDLVNLECDITAKYIERFVLWKDHPNDESSENSSQGVSLDMLKENGFI
ncbi:MAG: riboflavin synthase [Hyphomicrobiales bacterium]